ncbi:hypothetical protein [Hyphomicrobium sp.]|uniref:hypothetical protein n=1 Tax=Hyphomicrobium sp. TaxID=82 RepID=UPI002E363854|nr:hypothetical protein [Hyphomicrobium sp.]HEX2843225.1 hypothetical protein [Hyphomicrobium sp.]
MSLLEKFLAALGAAAKRRNERSEPVEGEASKRALTRKKQRLHDGFIVSEGMLQPRACTLRDMTALGGCVDIWDTSVKAALLRGPVTLYIPGDRKEVDCAVVWRRENSLGLKFTSSFRSPTRSYG